MGTSFSVSNIFSWALMLLFATVGVLNIFKVNAVLGISYLCFSLIYCPPIEDLLRKQTRFNIPYLLKIVLAFIVIWGSQAAGDLAEICGL